MTEPDERSGRRYVETVLHQRAFSLVYQPILHLDRGTLSGVEALCRFHDARPPDLWFEQCEAFGLAGAMDLAIIEMVTSQLEQLPPGYVAINLSPMSLYEPAPIEAALAVAARQRQIVVEITEHSVVDDYPAVIDGLARLRSLGVMLAVDDAGAGYSSFQHILRLRPDMIKLDRSITSSIDGDPARRALATAMVIFAGETGATVIAEGIETSGELAAIRSTGVTRGQGFGLGRPSALPLPAHTYEPVPYLDLRADGLRRPVLPGWGSVDEAPFDAAVAVAAHGLLGSLASMSTAVQLLRATEGQLAAEQHRAVCSVLERQISHVSGVLGDLVRGLPPEAVRALDDLPLRGG